MGCEEGARNISKTYEQKVVHYVETETLVFQLNYGALHYGTTEADI